MTIKKRWALLKSSEGGNPLRWLTDQQVRELLADPSKWGVDEFRHVDDMDADPNYWPPGKGVLLHVGVVMPERGGWRLPAEIDAETGGYWVTGNAPVALLGDVNG